MTVTTLNFFLQNSLESDLRVQDVCSNDFLKDLMNKYDTRAKNKEESMRVEQIVLDHIKDVKQRFVA